MRLLGIALGSLILGGLVLAVDYQVNGEGGPPNLADAVAAAFSTWEGVEGANVEADVTEEAQNRVRYGGGDDFGPETYSLTVQRTEADTRRVVILLNPTLEPQNDLRRRALLHETGVLLGLGTLSGEESGVMNPVFPAGAAASLSEADREAIVSLESFVAEDVNRDGTVDFYDLADLAASFGQSGVGVTGDVNGDGVVDDDDVVRLREAYVFTAPAEVDPSSGETGGAADDEFDGEFEGEFEDDELEDEDLDELTGATGGSETGGAPDGAFDNSGEEGPGGEIGDENDAEGDATGGADN